MTTLEIATLMVQFLIAATGNTLSLLDIGLWALQCIFYVLSIIYTLYKLGLLFRWWRLRR